MQISGVQDSSMFAATSSQQTSSPSSSFGSYFEAAQGSDNDAVQEFMKYAKETPEQRMFDSWLQSEGISQQQYAAMTPAQQQALTNKFEEQLQEQLKNKPLASLNSALPL